MQALILAAGMGNRLGRYTADNTKCMLSINGKTLIERALDALDAGGIQKCVIVAGYKRENLIRLLGNKYKNISIEYAVNDIYDKTNNIYSLYLAREYLTKDDTLLLESDIIFDENIITQMIASEHPTIAAVAHFESWMDGTVARIDDDNNIVSFIPKKLFNFDEKDFYYKTVNIYKFSREFSQNTYIPFLEAYIKSMGDNEYYEQVLRVIAALDKNELKAFVLTDQKWYEIDDVQDKAVAETIFAPGADGLLSRMQASYGGYWRYPALLDYCYLVNPYFPCDRAISEMKAFFTELLTRYPSGLDTQNLLSSKLFGLEEDRVLTGNGAAELIRALAPAVDGPVGIIYPTFNEYAERFCGKQIVSFTPKDFNYTKDDLTRFSAECNALVLINPDNPSGHYINKKDVLDLAEYFTRKGKTLILDESFIDFCDAEEDKSLLIQEVLDRYPALVVIKSLSKSYGIPGLRLGVLASGDRALIASARKNIPIWNINSFAEYFLQIIGKYQKDYAASCKKIAAERRRFRAALEETGLIKVFPSQANYFLCKIINGSSARVLAEKLLSVHNIFIKDLSGKKGIPDASYIRLAIRGREDNDRLISVLSPPPPGIQHVGIFLYYAAFPRQNWRRRRLSL
ncbi:MAG: aminotransferase class I/II-fold pyridoxal phosphate-dependent enzyme [Spirochaetaceae bacterium]|jgi:histidinol-phosphate/aromatic aminotransferase/cobyric acid decarboxylase-like protein/choline kinase|nr:aminotransferase class I/II-fold pyridoxal phosphate-dependent enzyme [Spirochaetaceae bacterium]